MHPFIINLPRTDHAVGNASLYEKKMTLTLNKYKNGIK